MTCAHPCHNLHIHPSDSPSSNYNQIAGFLYILSLSQASPELNANQRVALEAVNMSSRNELMCFDADMGTRVNGFCEYLLARKHKRRC